MEAKTTVPQKLVFACSGAADVGAITDSAARTIARSGIANMFCLAHIAAKHEDAIAKARTAGQLIALDGCEKDCALHVLNQAGLDNIVHVRLNDVGMVKGESPATPERVAAVCNAVTARLH
jgi:uncharacterized metal-binding protein